MLRHLKSQEEAHDFDDVQLMVGDLLLVRCPAIVRHWYPPEAVQALDDLGDEPWSDEHIRRALTLMQGEEEKYLDLQRRYALLKQIRARYRAFIIDEYQDTNPEHARLLSVFGVVEKGFRRNIQHHLGHGIQPSALLVI